MSITMPAADIGGTNTAPAVYLAGIGPAPTEHQVRDDENRVWTAGTDGDYHDPSNRHHLSPAELHARTDLVAVTR
jgi:hypothetical protein